MSGHHRPRRQATACTLCRHRRVRCSRQQPSCLQCSKRKQRCEYIDMPRAQIEFIAESIDSAPSATNTASSPLETWKSVFQSQAVLDGRADLETPKTQSPVVAAMDFAQGTTSTEKGRGRGGEGGEENQMGGPSARIDQEKAKHFDDMCFPPVDPAVQINSLGESVLSTLFSSLAPRETYLQHFENYILTVHPLLPLCDITTLRQTYGHFWEHLSSSTSAELLILILAILYTGAVNVSPAQDSHACLTIIGLYDMVVLALDLPTYHMRSPSTSLWLLQGVIIMSTFKASRFPPFTAFGFLPFAVRFAQSLQVHPHQDTDALREAERCERLWRHLVYMDIESTIASGLPGIIRPNRQGIQLRKLDKDFAGGDHDYLTPMEVAMQGQWQWAYRMHTWLERRPDQHEIIHFDRLIEALLHLIPDCDGSEWARIYLKMLIDRAYCVIGLQSWQIEQFKGTSCHSEVVRTSRSFLEKYLRLSEISLDLGFAWFIPGLVQPIHALMILLMHLSSCPHANDEEELSRDLVDRVFNVRVGHIMSTSRPTLKSTPSLNRQYNTRYRTLNAMRVRIWTHLKWPLVLPIESQEKTGFDPMGLADAEYSPLDWEAAMNIDIDGQELWNDPVTGSILPGSPNWDDWFL